MEQVYALGISCIQYIQERYANSTDYLLLINEVSNPTLVMEYLFPLLSILDSVFASQFLLCMSFGSWFNAVSKWWLLEDRPYWWVRETTFYAHAPRPKLRQFVQTCETGPGSPSGHSAAAAMLLLLLVMWTSHVMHDRKYYIWWWKVVAYPLLFAFLVSVMLARLFVAAHFPHQVILGAIVGAFVTPALCIYISDPYIWTYGFSSRDGLNKRWCWHIAFAILSIVIAVASYGVLLLCGWDPMWTIKLAFRWCEFPHSILVTTTPMYTLVCSTAGLLGWGLAVTAQVAQYRHYTKDRSLIIATFAVLINYHVFKYINNDLIGRDNAFRFYTWIFVLNAVRPYMYLSVVPYLASLPYSGKTQHVKKE